MSSTSVDNCIKYSNPEEKELSMVFNFHHLKVDYKNGDKWTMMDFDFKMLKDMNNKGKIVNIAWLVAATSTLGAHLGFTAGVESKMIIPVILSKLSAGVFAIMIALIFTRDSEKNVYSNI